MAHLALVFREKDLIDDDVVDIDVELSQLLDEAFCFVHGEELWYADSDEGCLGVVLHMVIHQFRIFLHLLHLAENGIQGLVQFLLAAENRAHVLHDAVEFLLQGQ